MGNTQADFAALNGSTVHPHACGEYGQRNDGSGWNGGSSPRVWGILLLMMELLGRSPVHPHACGEYAVLPIIHERQGGSSPRVWGILRDDEGKLYGTRFIPTRVGNTGATTINGALTTVHPHACGEYTVEVYVQIPYRGSSPRVWGIPIAKKDLAFNIRFIPTRVGNTSPVSAKIPMRPGSSPRVWGILPIVAPLLGYWRFIPTRVGNTLLPSR